MTRAVAADIAGYVHMYTLPFQHKFAGKEGENHPNLLLTLLYRNLSKHELSCCLHVLSSSE
jgi:hypothetical protein